MISSFPTMLLSGFIGPKISEMEFGLNKHPTFHLQMAKMSMAKTSGPESLWPKHPTFVDNNVFKQCQ